MSILAWIWSSTTNETPSVRLLEPLKAIIKSKECLNLCKGIDLVNISAGSSINLTTILLFVQTFSYIYQANVCSTFQILKNPFHSLPMFFTKISHVLVNHTNRTWNIWMSANHSIHHAKNYTRIRNMRHVLLFFLKLCWQSCWKFLKCVTNGVLIGLDGCILKSSSTFSI